VERIGPQHQAGSDSLLTGRAFFAMVKLYFEDKLNGVMYLGQLFRLGSNPKVGDGKVFLGVPRSE
jgi:CCR4-NOT transcription complex subunit 7/8